MMQKSETINNLRAFAVSFSIGILAVSVLLLVMIFSASIRKEATMSKIHSLMPKQSVKMEIINLINPQKPDMSPLGHGLDITETPATPVDHAPTIEDTSPAPLSSAKALPAAPISGLYEEHRLGLLPVKATDGRTPLSEYRKPALIPSGAKATMAIVINQYGLSPSVSDQLIDQLPDNITLIASPYADDALGWGKKARARGFELWLDLPFETNNYPYQDTGPYGILKRYSLQHNLENLAWLMTRVQGYAGVVSHIDDTFSQSQTAMKNIFHFLFSRGLGYLETANEINPYIESTSLVTDGHYMQGTLLEEASTTTQLEHVTAAIARAKDKGDAVLVIQATPNTPTDIQKWVAMIKENDIALLPLSAVFEHSWLNFKHP